MKKLALVFLLLLLLVACKTETVNVPFTATWAQEIPDREVFGGWEIYMANSENGTYSLVVTVPFSEVKNVYSYTSVVAVPENTNVKRWFKIRAYNKDGQKSGWSNTTYKLIQT